MFLKAGALSLALLLASRLLGLVRESAQAAAFGATGLADVAVVMLSLPDWWAGLVASGAMGYVLLPHWARQRPAQRDRVQRRVAGVLLAVGGTAGLALWIAGEQAVQLLAPGLPAEMSSVAARALVWSAMALPAALLAALWVTRLQHELDFIGMYSANLVVNGVLVLALFVFVQQAHGDRTLPALGACLMAAMSMRLLWLYWRLRRVKLTTLPFEAGPRSPAMPGAAMWLWAGLAAALPLALPFAARSLASQSGEGALATFNYGWKLVELPLVFAIQLIASLSFPPIARAFAAGEDTTGPREAVRKAYVLAWTLACAAAAALLVGAPALAQILFGWGRMDAAGLAQVAALGSLGAWTLPSQALIAVSLTVLATQGRMRPAVIAYAVALALLLGYGNRLDGGSLMLALGLLFVGVAAATVVAIEPRSQAWRHWLPWRALAGPAIALAVVGALGPSTTLALGRSTVAGVAAAVVAAMSVLAAGWLARVAFSSLAR